MSRTEELARITLRPLATPLPLGFLALAFGSCLTSAPQIGWPPTSTRSRVASAVLAFVAEPGQLDLHLRAPATAAGVRAES
jgi:hypothetical protein